MVGGVPARTTGTFINNAQHAIVTYQTADGVANPAYWVPANGTVTLVLPLTGTQQIEATGFADNDLLGANCQDSYQRHIACEWRPSTGTRPLGFINGGVSSGVTAVNQRGTELAGWGEDDAQNLIPAAVTSP
jgi:hypothetical protein